MIASSENAMGKARRIAVVGAGLGGLEESLAGQASPGRRKAAEKAD